MQSLPLSSTHRGHFLAVSLWPSVVVGKCSHKNQCFPAVSQLHHSEEEESCPGRPSLAAVIVQTSQEKRRFLDFSPLLLLVWQVQVGLMAADAAVRRPSVGLSAVAASSSGPTVGIAAARCGAGSAAAAAPRRARLHRKKLRQHTDRARVGGRWPRHLTPCCTHPQPPETQPPNTPGCDPVMPKMPRFLCNRCSSGFKCPAPFNCHKTLTACTLLSILSRVGR